MEDRLLNQLGGDRIGARQVDELIGLARGLAADGDLNQAEVEFLQKWLAANEAISHQPLIRTLYQRINDVLADGVLDDEEKVMLLETLNSFSRRDFELGEVSSHRPFRFVTPRRRSHSMAGRTASRARSSMDSERTASALCRSAVVPAAILPGRRLSW